MTTHKHNRVGAQAVWLTLFLTLLLPKNAEPTTTVYVSDTDLEANLRTGTSQENHIIGLLKAGTKVTLLGEQDGWAEVTLDDGRTGWILKRYLSERPPWRETALKLEKANEQLRKQLSKIRAEHRELMLKSAELEKEIDIRQGELQSVQQEYEDLKRSSTKYLNLKMAYENLQAEARQSKAKLEEVEKAYGKLKTSKAIRWFLSGAGVLILGWIVGSSAARLRRRRSSDYYKL